MFKLHRDGGGDNRDGNDARKAFHAHDEGGADLFGFQDVEGQLADGGIDSGGDGQASSSAACDDRSGVRHVGAVCEGGFRGGDRGGVFSDRE